MTFFVVLLTANGSNTRSYPPDGSSCWWAPYCLANSPVEAATEWVPQPKSNRTTLRGLLGWQTLAQPCSCAAWQNPKRFVSAVASGTRD